MHLILGGQDCRPPVSQEAGHSIGRANVRSSVPSGSLLSGFCVPLLGMHWPTW